MCIETYIYTCYIYIVAYIQPPSVISFNGVVFVLSIDECLIEMCICVTEWFQNLNILYGYIILLCHSTPLITIILFEYFKITINSLYFLK